jgi:hypothetical protein
VRETERDKEGLRKREKRTRIKKERKRKREASI